MPQATRKTTSDSDTFESLRTALDATLAALAARLDDLVRNGAGGHFESFNRRTRIARLNLPRSPSMASPDSTRPITMPLLGPTRIRSSHIGGADLTGSAHARRAHLRREHEVLELMRDLAGHLATAAPHHFHADVTTISAQAGAPKKGARGALRPTLSLAIHEFDLSGTAILPANAARKLAQRVSVLSEIAPPDGAAPPLPWRQYRVGHTATHAPCAARAMETYLALASPDVLATLRDPSQPETSRALMRTTLPEVSELIAQADLLANL